MCGLALTRVFVRAVPALTPNAWTAPLLPPPLLAPLPEDHLSDDSESDTEDAEASHHPNMALASSLFTTSGISVPEGYGPAAVPRVLTETPRDRARLATARKERATAIEDARWLDRRLAEVDANIVDPAMSFRFGAV